MLKTVNKDHLNELNGPNIKLFLLLSVSSRVAQWKRAGPITQSSEDQNVSLPVFSLLFYSDEYLINPWEHKLTSARCWQRVTFYVSQNWLELEETPTRW